MRRISNKGRERTSWERTSTLKEPSPMATTERLYYIETTCSYAVTPLTPSAYEMYNRDLSVTPLTPSSAYQMHTELRTERGGPFTFVWFWVNFSTESIQNLQLYWSLRKASSFFSLSLSLSPFFSLQRSNKVLFRACKIMGADSFGFTLWDFVVLL